MNLWWGNCHPCTNNLTVNFFIYQKHFPWIKLRTHFEEGLLLHQMLASLLETLLQTSQVTMNFKHSVIFSPNFLQKFQLMHALEIMMVEVGLPLMEGLRHLKRSGGFYKKQGYAC